MKISACIICKNEEVMIETCLQSLCGVDEIIVVDTGSTDNTIQIASKYTSNIFTDCKWNDDFAEARNYALSKATGDYIISIDADEVLLSSIKDIREQLENIGESNALNVVMTWDETHSHKVPRIFKSDLRWSGRCHESIACNKKDSDIKIQYRKSPAHDQDPDRNIRILTKSVEETQTPRDIFYLAREYYDRQNYTECVSWMVQYIKVSTWRPEKSDAYLTLARCLWNMHRGDEARLACLNAILLNPNFKEALNFMAEMSWEKEALTWRSFALIATNEDVLFIRGTK